MIFDRLNQFSGAQALTATALSTDVIDTFPMVGNPNLVQNLGGIGSLFLVVQVTTAAGGTTPTLAVTLESDSTANLATSPTVHFSSGTIAAAGLGVGTLLVIQLPIGSYERFLGLRYTLGGTTPTVSVTAFLTRGVQNWRPYASATAPNL